jgi:hypothetical protein
MITGGKVKTFKDRRTKTSPFGENRVISMKLGANNFPLCLVW